MQLLSNHTENSNASQEYIHGSAVYRLRQEDGEEGREKFQQLPAGTGEGRHEEGEEMLKISRGRRKALDKDNRKFKSHLIRLPDDSWSGIKNCPSTTTEVWRSNGFLVQVHDDGYPGVERLSICRTSVSGNDWTDNIAWEEMQDLKRQCGRGDKCAIEIYPADKDIVNVANMRHIWVSDMVFEFAWRKA